MPKVNHPRHYNEHPSGVECIDIVEHFNFNLGSAIKYIWRADLKDEPVQDLRKALWYIQREIERREGELDEFMEALSGLHTADIDSQTSMERHPESETG
jgi:hypothetical protein